MILFEFAVFETLPIVQEVPPHTGRQEREPEDVRECHAENHHVREV
jgi:hypothetical protein